MSWFGRILDGAGHSQFSITERYVHAAQVAFPGAVELAETRMFGEGE
jgi:hypothetical protein